ncbi:hypothetical protein CRV03_07405 [Arcobacter sp. F155]|uniref:DUF1007 family protein n=1 Tax=Arcobacter sp. F155 TaxID=2044512 RepID=UPI00100B302A|nr:DUF1007 family protein [Arcobacter sp. F155]RXJ77082.1 hypothetical protein CRV03_07405 [Arcobacter sp. F155]
MKKINLIIIFLISFLTKSFSHPHSFIEVFPTLNIKGNKVSNLNIKWVLDEMTSSMLIMELDSNGDGKIDKKENEFIYKNYFISLEEYNFYTEIKSLNHTKNNLIPKDFKAYIKEQRMIYSFDINKAYPLEDLKISFFDKDLFMGLVLEKEYIRINGTKKNQIKKIKKKVFGVK